MIFFFHLLSTSEHVWGLVINPQKIMYLQTTTNLYTYIYYY